MFHYFRLKSISFGGGRETEKKAKNQKKNTGQFYMSL